VFLDPHVTWGMTAAFEPMQMLSKMPFHEIMRLSLLGAHERMSAERAREIGLVSEVVPRDELRERAGWAARVIADSPPLAIQGTMRALWTALHVGRPQAIELANLFTRIGSDPRRSRPARTASRRASARSGACADRLAQREQRAGVEDGPGVDPATGDHQRGDGRERERHGHERVPPGGDAHGDAVGMARGR
jgi:enoyl-CoA hydratase/carnithine racemase